MARRRLQGFTLIELMVVATIIGVSVVAFTPSFIFAMADRRAASAVSEVVRVGRRARAETIGTQRAHLVWIRSDAGTVQMLRGTTAHCDIENWPAISALCPASAVVGTGDQRQCLENLNFNDTHWFHAPFQIRLRPVPIGQEGALVALLAAPGPGASHALCYEPSGATLWANLPALLNPTPFSTMNQGAAAGGGFTFAVGLFHLGDNAVVGTPRVLSYPLGTTPRRLR
jgi:prepilin-type N-terminal cleavage/methylation domain-containing protein